MKANSLVAWRINRRLTRAGFTINAEATETGVLISGTSVAGGLTANINVTTDVIAESEQDVESMISINGLGFYDVPYRTLVEYIMFSIWSKHAAVLGDDIMTTKLTVAALCHHAFPYNIAVDADGDVEDNVTANSEAALAFLIELAQNGWVSVEQVTAGMKASRAAAVSWIENLDHLFNLHLKKLNNNEALEEKPMENNDENK